jgi:hypothetical protein
MSQDLTTADIAGRPGGESPALDDEVQAPAQTAEVGPPSPLFDDAASDRLRSRWAEAQTAFVDSPQLAVKDADALVAELMQQLAETFARERSALEEQWARGEDVTTEELRVVLTRYRSFFERLLDVNAA